MTATDNREHARELQETETRSRKIAMTLAGLLALALAIGIFLATRPDPGKADANDTTETPTGLIVSETAANANATRIDIFYDYACGHCATLDDEYHADLEQAAADGKLDVRYHPVSVMGTDLSTLGAIAEHWARSADPDRYVEYRTAIHDQILAPIMNGETKEMPATNTFVDLARNLGYDQTSLDGLKARLDNPDTGTALDDTTAFLNAGHSKTPTVLVDGKEADSWAETLDKALNDIN